MKSKTITTKFHKNHIAGCSLILAMFVSTSVPANTVTIPENVTCTDYTKSEKHCVSVAAEVQAMQEAQFGAFLSGNFGAALSEGDMDTIFLLPNGASAKGPMEIASNLPALAGTSLFSFAAITNQFHYRPLDQNTVLVSGPVDYTLIDYERNANQRVVKIVHTVIYRRDSTKPSGWRTLHEQFSYFAPLNGPYRIGASQFFDWGI